LADGIIDGQVGAEDENGARSETESRAVIISADAKEGPLAFAEKRDPVWQGR
jgi:crotonobetainyl-CoA hydratase